MRLSKLIRMLLPLAFMLGLSSQLFATTVLQMNLDQLTVNSESVYRGTIVSMEQITVEGGGGELPALHYKVRVTEVLKGDVPTIKGEQMAEFRILGNVKAMNAGRVLPAFPVIQSGTEYLLFVSPAGPIGLTSTMGLGQGCFNFTRQGDIEMVVNAFDNVGLFKGMDAASMPASGPAEYAQVADMVRAAAGN